MEKACCYFGITGFLYTAAMIRKLSAHYVYPLSSSPVKYGILVVDSDKKTIEVIDRNKDFKEIASLEFYSGILVPGFVKQSQPGNLLFEEIKKRFLTSEELTLTDAFDNNIFGRFELNDGVNLISGIDFTRMRLTVDSQIKLLVPAMR